MIFALFGLSLCSLFYVMAPLDILDSEQKVSYADKLAYWLDRLKYAGVDGVMIDVWWGLVETQPNNYKFDGYDTVFSMIKQRGLNVIPVMSFHQCGGNVGDNTYIPIPSFVKNSAEQPFYVDADGHVDQEYISLGYDSVSIGGRTPIKMYHDFMAAFNTKFSSLIKGGTIADIEIGLGPCGELRYPAYQTKYWGYPGCGEFQSYDKMLTAAVAKDAATAGKSGYGHSPNNLGGYNVKPGESFFWRDESWDGWKSDYGQWFIKWYSKQLTNHAQNVLSEARSVFPNAQLSAKIAGVHWWYNSGSHCSETTAGFNNFYFYNGYRDIASALKKFNVNVCFTCLEMTSGDYGSNPESLVQQVLDAANWAGLKLEGENALAVYDGSSYYRIRQWAKKGVSIFTYLRLCDDLMNDANYWNFKQLVSDVHNGN